MDKSYYLNKEKIMNYSEKRLLCSEIFNSYAKTFDLENPNIKRKFVHSYNVAKYAEIIGKSIFDNENDIYICFVIGLLHDISRFKQWTLYGSHKDTKEYNHPDKSVEILFDENMIEKFPVDKKYYEIIKFSIANHGALKIDETQKDEKILKFAKMIRDADKLDLLRQSMNQGQPSFANEFSSNKISEKVLNTFYKKQCINKADCNSVADRAILQTAMSFDINYDISKKIYLENEFYMASYINYKDVLSEENAKKLLELALFMKKTFEESLIVNTNEK